MVPQKENIQKFVYICKEKLDAIVVLTFNPFIEKKDAPKIDGVIEAFDLTYEDQLSYAKSCDYAVYMHGAGMAFAQLANLPQIMICPCYIHVYNPIGIIYVEDRLKVLTRDVEEHGKNFYTYSPMEQSNLVNKNVEGLTPEEVFENLNELIKKRI